MLSMTRRLVLASLSTLALAAAARKRASAAELKRLTWINPDSAPAQLPPFRLVSADGTSHMIADFVGQALVVNFWATWCVPCVAEMPALALLAEQLQADNIAVLPLSSDRGGAAAVEKFYHAHDITGLPIWLDPDGDAGHTLKLRGIPTTLVIDRQGRERARAEGAVDWAAQDTVSKIKSIIT